ncbi:MAG: hypothetical protein GC181_04055 [Bacteroidetes bacterium]|nr:hypothetical protein [Bacteroidota bacterium]
MSQFDFPRINFYGHAFIDPATANNNYFLPLVIYDPVNSMAFLPPRLFIHPKFRAKTTTTEDFEKAIKPFAVLNDPAGNAYIEINSVCSVEIFNQWCQTPLGKHSVDQPFHKLYALIRVPGTGKNLIDKCPGYWNYHGKMTFGFENVRVTSVDTFSKESGKVNHDIHSDNWICRSLIGAELSMNDRFNTRTGVMIDVCPSMSVHSQVFCDELSLSSSTKSWFSGKPYKGTVRTMNPFRIVNQNSICAASGVVYSAMELSETEMTADFRALLPESSLGRGKLKGLLFRYSLLEVVENWEPDYEQTGEVSNPARCTVAGSISPWFDGDLKSFSIGRQLLGEVPFLGYRKLFPILCSFNKETKILSIDLIGNVPEVNLDVPQSGKEPIHFPQQYALYDLGELRLFAAKGDAEIQIGSVNFSESDPGRKTFLETGGIRDFSCEHLPDGFIGEAEILLKGIARTAEHENGIKAILARESRYLITSDENGLYANEGDDPALGYISYQYPKEACRLRIFERGNPVINPVALTVLHHKVDVTGESVQLVELCKDNMFFDGQQLIIPLHKTSNSVYLFADGMELPDLSSMYKAITRTGFFISLRILPNRRFEKYLDPQNPEYREQVNFDLVYEELFKLYDLIYPVSGKISPFHEKAFIRARHFIKELMSDENWASSSYMPSTRELSDNQKRIFLKWFDQVEELESQNK